MLFQLLPIIVLILSTFSGSLFDSTPDYSFHQTYSHRQLRKTDDLKIPFYATSGFDRKYRGYQLDAIYEEIETEYINMLKINCKKEKQHVRELKYYAKHSYSKQVREAYEDKIRNFRMSHCKRVKQVYAQS